MLYLGSVTEGLVRASVPLVRGSQLSLSLRAWVLHPNTRRHVRLLGPRFKTGRLKPLRQHQSTTEACTETLNPNRCIQQGAITHPEVPHSPNPFPPVKIHAGP